MGTEAEGTVEDRHQWLGDLVATVASGVYEQVMLVRRYRAAQEKRVLLTTKWDRLTDRERSWWMSRVMREMQGVEQKPDDLPGHEWAVFAETVRVLLEGLGVEEVTNDGL